MPLYTYKCECGEEYDELFTTIKEAEELEKHLKCPKCGSQNKERYVVGQQRVVFKGEGWTPRGKDYDSTDSIKDHVKDLEKQRNQLTSKDLYGDGVT